MENTNILLSIEHVHFAYEQNEILKDITFKIFKNDFLGVIGPNGGGKTTLMKIILGQIKPTHGTLHFYKEQREVNEINIGYLPQYSSIDRKFPISVFDVVSSGLNKLKKTYLSYSREQKETIQNVICRMGLEGLEKKHIGTLSGGQLQRVLLGRAIVSSPELLILDEPNTYIDKKFEEHLYKILEELNKECTIIIVSHDIGTILQNVKSIVCIDTSADYHPDTEVSEKWVEEKFDCPIDLLGHGEMPHRILKCHHNEH